ncbi:SusC/RagA family TonB-linked outer membrane protein [Niastella populi]|uniref:SusC/RagA family TonB-linked outer membrane protein n=1 Tax=Niastella populi TaxID=550983 RepID=A0A1V9FEI9_9BACT|nr:TonB-dependent receptor [Niastella populi]OQP56773.1 SusC/RagA family TonB-linked outer membrane protein [Niastella populi]
MKPTKTIRLRKMMLWSILLVFLLNTNAFAQSTKVSGAVADQHAAPVPGATVTVKKTNRSTVTDNAGKFTIEASPKDVLEISAVGFTSQEIKVGTGNLTVQLQEAVNQLENVIVIGYGTQKKKLVTGATSQVKGEDLAKLNTTNALQALQGQAAGVNITSTSGQPGGGFKVNIRGAGTIGNSNPLYVVDGVITNDITYLNNADIASVDILKDAASCAIYGINGANGVVLITTRNGKSGKKDGQISIDAYYGVQNIARKLPLLNAEQYATMQNEAAINSGKVPLFTQAQIDDLAKGSSILPAHGTDWLHQIFSSNVPISNYTIAANGGSDVSTYSLGGSYMEQGGIIGSQNLSNYKRINFRANTERKMYNGVLKIGEHLTFSYINQKGVADGGLYSGNVLAAAIGTSPLLAMYDEKGKYLSSINSTIYNGGVWNNTEANPYALMQYNNQNESKTQRLLGDVYAELQPVKNLRIRTVFGLNYSSSANHSYRPVYDKLSIYAFNDYENISQGGSQGYTWNFDNTINYLFNINEHKFDVLAGSAMRKYQGTWLSGSNTGATLFGSFDRGYLSNSTVTSVTMSSDTSAANRQTVTNTISLSGNANAVYAQSSFFGRVNYSFKEKYLVSAIFRADGSTMFAPGRQWGYFPSFSAGWVASNEDFMTSTKNWLNFLKVRASWGTNGNDGISAFNYLSLISLSNARYNFGSDNTTLTQGSYPSTIGVENTKWESSRQTNIGIDARFLNNKLDVSLDLYNKTTKDWLIAAPLLATAGVSNPPYINGGDVTNKGIELQLGYNGNIGNGFTYNVSGSYAYNKNVVNNIPTADGIIHGGTNSLFVNGPEFFRAAAGNPIGYFWGYKTAGVFQNNADVAAWTGKNGMLQPNAQPGDLKLVDYNGDGVIDAKDKTNIGDPNPHHIFGFRFSANYKNFDLSVTTNGVAGNKIVQSYRSPGQWANMTTDMLSRWHGEGTSNAMPRITQNSSNWVEFTDLYIHDGSYWRVSNITLGYDVAKIVRWKNLSQFRLYVAAQNPVTFTKYRGMDPEVGASVADASGAYFFGQGVDNGFYPRPKVYMAGVNIIF